jgi:N-sulfoglucosamine sulfohydrolase
MSTIELFAANEPKGEQRDPGFRAVFGRRRGLNHRAIMNRRRFAVRQLLIALAIWCLVPSVSEAESRPNILFCISDDQSWLHAGAMGDPVVKTPAFDRIAREGILFTHAFCDAPSCAPSRSAILTGQHIWRLEEAGNIHGRLPAKFATYTAILEQAGYVTGSYSKA